MKNNKEKGFTLVELLAVIAILAILVLLAIPMITAQVEKSRKAAFVESADRAVSAVNDYLLKSNFSSKNDVDVGETCEDGICTFTLSQINSLLDKELGKSPFGSSYDTKTTIKSQEVEINGKKSFIFYACIIDENKNGFGFTSSNDIKTSSIEVGSVNDCGQLKSGTITAKVGDGGSISDTIGWTLNGKKTEASISINFETEGVMPEPTRQGYVFDGWAATIGGNTVIMNRDKVLEYQQQGKTLTMEAQWTRTPYLVSLNLGGGTSGSNLNGWGTTLANKNLIDANKLESAMSSSALSGLSLQPNIYGIERGGDNPKGYSCANDLQDITATGSTNKVYLGWGIFGQSQTKKACIAVVRDEYVTFINRTSQQAPNIPLLPLSNTGLLYKQVTAESGYNNFPEINKNGFKFLGIFENASGGKTAQKELLSYSDHTLYTRWDCYRFKKTDTFVIGNIYDYAGLKWTAVGYDNDGGTDDGVRLALNGYSGSGSYNLLNMNTEVKQNLIDNNATLTAAYDNCLQAQVGGFKITSDSGITTNAPAVEHWTNNGEIYIPNTVYEYTGYTTTRYAHGYTVVTNQPTPSTLAIFSNINTGCTGPVRYNGGTKVNYTSSNSTITYPKGACNSSTTSSYFRSNNYAVFYPNSGLMTPSKKTLPMTHYSYKISTLARNDSYTKKNTKTFQFKLCGGSNHGKTQKLIAKSSKEYTHYKPDGSTTAPNYSSKWYWYYAGTDTSDTGNSKSPSYVRKYDLTASDCAKRTQVAIGDLTKTIYYRPVIKVKIDGD